MRIAYMMSRFPKLTETYILYEILALEKQGATIEIYPLIREKATVVHPEAQALGKRAHYTPFISIVMLLINFKTLLTQPITYFRTLITVIRTNWGSSRFLLGNLVYFPKAVYLAHLMRKHQIDHLHAHFASFPATVAFIIHQFSGISYSFTAHGSDLHRDQHMLCEKIQDAKQVITVSQYNKTMMIDHCGKQYASKIHIVHCGIDIERFKADLLPEANQLSIICIGTLHEVKGQRYLLEACGMLKERAIPFHCHLVADGEDRPMLEQLVNTLGIHELVTFHGRVPQAEVINILKKANVSALNSVPSSDGRREGIPVALMESMAFGLPVVSTRLSGIPELVDDGITGFLTEPRDSQAIADALTKLAQDADLRQKMGAAGRQKIEAEFELHRNAEELLAIFQQP